MGCGISKTSAKSSIQKRAEGVQEANGSVLGHAESDHEELKNLGQQKDRSDINERTPVKDIKVKEESVAIYKNRVEDLGNTKSTSVMEECKDTVDKKKDDESADPREVITKQIKKGSKRHDLLKIATIDMFVEEGKKLIDEINVMPMTLDDMPNNFQKAVKLRLVYQNARYNIGAEFCVQFLDIINEQGLFSCVTKAMRKLQETWPQLFSETLDPNEVKMTSPVVVCGGWGGGGCCPECISGPAILNLLESSWRKSCPSWLAITRRL